MNAEPPRTRIHIVHQPRRPGYARRYPAQSKVDRKNVQSPMQTTKLSVRAYALAVYGYPRSTGGSEIWVRANKHMGPIGLRLSLAIWRPTPGLNG